MNLYYKYDNRNIKKIIKSGLIILIIMIAFLIVFEFIDFLNFDFNKMVLESFLMGAIAITLAMAVLICILIVIDLIYNKYKNQTNNKIIRYGNKVNGFITSCYSHSFRSSATYYLKVDADGKTYEISDLDNNDTYEVLKEYLLDFNIIPIQIPIDIYIYENKAYADLKSVNLDKIIPKDYYEKTLIKLKNDDKYILADIIFNFTLMFFNTSVFHMPEIFTFLIFAVGMVICYELLSNFRHTRMILYILSTILIVISIISFVN